MKARLLSILPTGRENGTSVPALARALGISDRECRALIEELVTEDHAPICSQPTRNGIYLAASAEELDQARAQLHSRAMSLLERCRALRLAAEEMSWTPTLFEIEEVA